MVEPNQHAHRPRPGPVRRYDFAFYGTSLHAIETIRLSRKLGELIWAFPVFNRLAPAIAERL